MPPPEPSAPSSSARCPLFILLVEDHALLASNLGRFLEAYGHRVTRVPSLAAACQALADGNFDLLLTEVVLPDGDCHDVFSKCPELLPRFLVTMSAFDGQRYEAAFGEREVRSHLIKPFATEVLDEILEGFARELAPERRSARRREIVPPLVVTILREASRRRDRGELSEADFEEKLSRLTREELTSRGLELIVRPLSWGSRFLIKQTQTGRVCDMIDWHSQPWDDCD